MKKIDNILKKLIVNNALKKVDKEVWIAGKGPSLDRFDWDKAGPARFGINETAFIIPDCFGAFALDSYVLEKFKNDLPNHVIVFLRNRKNFKFPNQYVYLRGKEYKHGFGTIHTAIQVLYYLGARAFHLIGCDALDGGTGYAKSVTDIKAEGLNRDKYQRISTKIQDLIWRIDDAQFYLEHRKKGMALWKRPKSR